MPTHIVIEIASAEQAHLIAELRRARRGHWLALHIVLLLAQHHSPSEIATFLLCARSTVYRVAREWQDGSLDKSEARMNAGIWPVLWTYERARCITAFGFAR